MYMFHIHVDASSIAPDFDLYLSEELGFQRNDFGGHPDNVEAYEPPNHLTLKTTSSEVFKTVFDAVVAYASNRPAMHGYVEGEFIPLDREIALIPFNAGVRPPFRFTTSGLPPGTFRETEIHITLSRDQSDPRLLQVLEQMGFFAAFLPKPYGMAEIFTVQGTREKINILLQPLIEYLERAGGAAECSIKEERIARWWVSSLDVSMPPVVDTIEWESNKKSGVTFTNFCRDLPGW
jgi:hypothetical protein